MPEFCPECNAAMHSTPVQWRGLVRPVTAGDRRNRRDQRKPMSANRAASIEHVGEVLVHYVCDECGECVKPGETHIRSMDRTGVWVAVRRKRGSGGHSGRALLYRQKRQDPEQGEALRAYHRENYRINAELRRKQRRERDAKYRERLRKAKGSAQAEMRRISHSKEREERRQADS